MINGNNRTLLQRPPIQRSRVDRRNSNSLDLNDPEVLRQIYSKLGKSAPNVKPKPSVLERLSGILSAFMPADALTKFVRTGDVGSALKLYGKDLLRGLTLQGDREGKHTGEDLMGALGMQPGIGRKVAGLGFDVVADPGNVLLGPLFKGVGKVAGKATGKLGKGLVSQLDKIPAGQKALGYADNIATTLKGAFIPKYGLKKVGAESLGEATDVALRTAGVNTSTAIDPLLEDLAKAFKGNPDQVKDLADIFEGTLGQVTPKVPEEMIPYLRNLANGSLTVKDSKKLLDFPDIKKAIKAMRGESPLYAKKLDELFGVATKAAKSSPSQKVRGVLEATSAYMPNELSDALKLYTQQADTVGKTAQELGGDFLHSWQYTNKNIDNYLSAGKITPKQGDILKKLNIFLGKQRALERKLGEGVTDVKGAYFPHTYKDMLQTTSGHGKKFFQKMRQIPTALQARAEGLVLDDPITSLVKRTYASEQLRAMKDLTEQLTSGAFKAADGTDLLVKVGEKDVLPEGFERLGGVVSKHGLGGKSVAVVEGIKDLRGYAAPTEVVDHLNKVYGVLKDEKVANSFLKAFDAINRVFKASVTGYFPSFHARNAMSNVFNNWLAGVSDPRVYKKAVALQKGKGELPEEFAKLFNKHGIKTFEEFRDWTAKHGISGFGGFGYDIDESAKTLKGLLGKSDKSLVGKLKRFAFADAPRKVGDAVETNAKVAHLVDRLQKGDSLKDAAMSVKKYLFDYSELTDFERKVLKRVIPFYCVPEDSLILTKEGWLNLDEVSIGDTALTYNVDKDVMEWSPVNDIAIFDHDQALMTWTSKRHKLRFTHEHKWVTERESAGIALRKGNELNTSDSIRVISNYNGVDDSSLSVENARLLGWLITDGYYRWRGNHCEAMLFQTPHKFMDEVLDVAGGKPRKPHPVSGCITVPVLKERTKGLGDLLKRSKHTDDWIDIVSGLSIEAATAMYDAMMMADGTYGSKQTSFACQKDGVARTFEVLATLLGKRVVRNDKGFYISEYQRLGLKHGSFGEEHYTGRVWCPSTDNQTWVMKQGKLITITGNTWSRKNIPLQLESLYKHPAKYGVVAKTTRSLGSGELTDEEKALLPETANEGLGIVTKSDGKIIEVLRGLGLPFEDLNKLGSGAGIGRDIEKNILSQLPPILKEPLEQVMDKNFFFGGDKRSWDKAPNWVKVMPGFVKDYLDYDEDAQRVNPAKMSAVNSILAIIGGGRFANETSKLMDDDRSKVEKAVRLLSGVRTDRVDVEKATSRKRRQETEALTKFLQDAGIVDTFERNYISKDKRSKYQL